MPTRYVHNYDAFGRRVLRSGAMEAAMRDRADRIKARFVETAPVGPPYEDDEHRGRFRDSAEVTSGIDGGENHDLAYGRVTVNDPNAMSIEYGFHPKRDARGRFVEGGGGDEYIPGHHTLTRAMDAAAD